MPVPVLSLQKGAQGWCVSKSPATVRGAWFCVLLRQQFLHRICRCFCSVLDRLGHRVCRGISPAAVCVWLLLILQALLDSYPLDRCSGFYAAPFT
jgi:hypothetical protein